MLTSDTPMTDAIRSTPLMGETVTPHKWDAMTEHARRLERELADAIEALRAIERTGACNCPSLARALLQRLGKE